ncbi:uncharacterized protein [Drosophila bipectinata]|uniref:uncharacterized protein isoform X2 n=1 Tax=Drosophila bipectinata TaxID=42026 RepID=UPI0038B2ADC9
MSYYIIFFLVINIIWYKNNCLVFCEKENNYNIYEILDELMTPFNVFTNYAATAETKSKEKEELYFLMNYNRESISKFMISHYLTNEIIHDKKIYKAEQSNKKLTFLYPSTKNNFIFKILDLERFNQFKKHNKRNTECALYRKIGGSELRKLTPRAVLGNAGANEYDYGHITGYAYKGIHSMGPNKIIGPQTEAFTEISTRSNFKLDLKNKNGSKNSKKDYISQQPFSSLFSTDSSLQKKNKEEDTNTMMLPLDTTDSTSSNEEIEEVRRRKRSTTYNKFIPEIHTLSSYILHSVDHLTRKNNYTTNIFSRYYCILHSFQSKIQKRKKLWLQFYRLGTDWLLHGTAGDYGSLWNKDSMWLKLNFKCSS